MEPPEVEQEGLGYHPSPPQLQPKMGLCFDLFVAHMGLLSKGCLYVEL